MDVVTLGIAAANAQRKHEITLPASNGTDNTTILNAALAGGNKRVRGRHGQTYYLTAPGILESKTKLDMTECTVRLEAGSNSNILQSKAFTAARSVSDLTTTAGATVTSATAAFTSDDVGKPFTFELRLAT